MTIRRMTAGFTMLTVALCLAAAAAWADDETVDLKLNLKQGQTFRIRQTARSSSTADLGGRTDTGTEVFTTGLTFTVQKVAADGASRLYVVFDDPTYTMQGNTGGEPVKQLDQVLRKALSAVNGCGFTATITSNGIVRSIEGADDAAKSATYALAGQPESVQRLGGLFIQRSISEPQLREGLESLFSILPGRPVKIGERWSRQRAFNDQFMTIQSEVFCKVLQSSNGVSNVKVYEQVKSYNLATPFGNRLLLSGVSEGTVDIDEATGIPIRGSLTTKLSGKTTVPGAEKQIPTSVTSVSTISRY